MEPTRQEFLFLDGPLPRVVFYTLTFLSLGLMVWQIAGRARLWMKGRPLWWKPNYLGGVGAYVLAQRKVMGSRSKTGAPMHLLIFYGFLAMLLATTLLAVSTYGPLIGIPHFHQGGYYLAYETVFDAFGLVFLAGVGWAAVRKYRMSQELGEPVLDTETGKLERSSNPQSSEWKDYAVLAVLFMLGLTGFLLEAARISAHPEPWDGVSFVGFGMAKVLPTLSPEGYRVVWWFHMVWVWTFFVTLPQMRLKHIVVATLAAAGNPKAPIGQLPEVPGEVAGARVATDYSRWHLMSLDACMSCGRCTEVCPAYGAGKSLNPKQVVQDVHRTLTIGDGVAARVSEDSLWACTTCHACVEACPVLIRHTDLIVDARRDLVADGKLSGTATTVLRQVGATGSAWGQDASGREDWMKGLEVPLCRDGVDFEFLFWVGCAGATDPGAVKTTRAFAELLTKAGVRFACLGREEACTGDPARRIGDEATFGAQREGNQGVFAKYGVKKIVTACPHCLNSLRNEYGWEDEVEVVHHTELLDRLVQDGKLKPFQPKNGETAYHDPCYLARVNGVSDAPRRLGGGKTSLDSGVPLMLKEVLGEGVKGSTFAEPEHVGKKTLCCGAGGGRMWMEEAPDQRPGNRRAEELLATGAKEVAVACPFCRIMLDASLKQVSDDEIRLVDLAEKMNEANQ